MAVDIKKSGNKAINKCSRWVYDIKHLFIIYYYCIIGDHSVEVKLGGSHVEGSPFLVKAYNANKVKVTDINSGVVGKPVFFSSKYLFFMASIKKIREIFDEINK